MIDNVGASIAALRKNKGVKQEDVAKAVGVSPQAVSKWENGGTPDTELLPIIADYFGVSIDRLFGRTKADFSHIEADVTKYVSELLDSHFSERGDFDNIPNEVHAESI
ncbi:MAG: helix-turn-helix domain-containing protein [Defluviitaleaceae bacterium]|nr:helix-turn-helix domain-containing protein [Defluviitaleaceae bacterium]MCL2240363.1 helix-turn-helix domain-containing protein [Defluviitaleaceae bacterium]